MNAPHDAVQVTELLDRLSDVERRLDRLEENTLFQERTLAGLHEALLEQQQQLDQTDKVLHSARRALLDLREAFAEQQAGQGVEIPPHYQHLA